MRDERTVPHPDLHVLAVSPAAGRIALPTRSYTVPGGSGWMCVCGNGRPSSHSNTVLQSALQRRHSCMHCAGWRADGTNPGATVYVQASPRDAANVLQDGSSAESSASDLLPEVAHRFVLSLPSAILQHAFPDMSGDSESAFFAVGKVEFDAADRLRVLSRPAIALKFGSVETHRWRGVARTLVLL